MTISPLRIHARAARCSSLLGRCLVLPALALLTVLAPGCSSDAITQKLPIGAKCAASSECGTSPIFHCDSQLPDGYCTKGCLSDGDCPAGSICLIGDGYNLCKKTCSTKSDCRTYAGGAKSYDCVPKSTSTETFPFASSNYCDAPPVSDGGVTTPSDGGTPPGDGGTPSDGGGTPSDGGM